MHTHGFCLTDPFYGVKPF